MARIAVVDDDPHLRKLLETLLNRRSHEVAVFPDGADALLDLSQGGYDLVLSDVQMPRLDGISLCKALRESYSKRRLPILLLSVLDKEDDILRAMEAGASDYLVKPYTLAMLQAKISYHLTRPRSHEPDVAPPLLVGAPDRLPYEFDDYELLKVLGQGSYATVYQARRRADGLPVALKMLERAITHDRESLARYFREVALILRVQSPHVVRFISSGYEQGRYYLTMEFIDGPSAADIVQDHGRMPVGPVMRLGMEVARAVGALKEQGLVHRDIKPANVLVAQDGHAVLVDFGLVKTRHDQGLTHPDDIMGTADYIAPEVINGEHEHPGSDMYSLGVTLFELLAGRRPFTAKTPYEILAAVASGKPAPPLRGWVDVPEDVAATVHRMIHPDPRQRLADPRQAELELLGLWQRYPT